MGSRFTVHGSRFTVWGSHFVLVLEIERFASDCVQLAVRGGEGIGSSVRLSIHKWDICDLWDL
jgi:hypothetical protein